MQQIEVLPEFIGELLDIYIYYVTRAHPHKWLRCFFGEIFSHKSLIYFTFLLRFLARMPLYRFTHTLLSCMFVYVADKFKAEIRRQRHSIFEAATY